jgi:protein-L-isoaspartate(D-aspartate) O-methyltransferase
MTARSAASWLAGCVGSAPLVGVACACAIGQSNGTGGSAPGPDVHEQRRRSMVASQIEARGVRDPRVLAALARVPRHRFVPPALVDEAYADHPLPIGQGQTISQPYIVALMTELAAPAAGARVLEVGTGSGYQTAVLAELARRVCSIERLPRLAERARTLLESLGYMNVWIRVGDGTLGWLDEAPFDRILVAAGGPTVPQALFDQLAEGGRMVLPIGDAESQTLTVVENAGGQMRTRAAGECKFVKLVGKYAWEA